MTRKLLLFAAAALAITAGCNKQVPTEDINVADAPSDGRYLGIGTLPAGELWEQLDINEQDLDNSSARLADDNQRIVVVDSKTGEVRQCGDMSGHCVSMNPWTDEAPQKQTAPVRLKKHAADLRAEQEAREKAERKKWSGR